MNSLEPLLRFLHATKFKNIFLCQGEIPFSILGNFIYIWNINLIATLSNLNQIG